MTGKSDRPGLKTKSVYEAASKDDGARILVTRYWPRGVKKDRQDLWLRGLGPEPGLIKLWKAGKLSFAEFKRRYLAEFGGEEKRRLLEDLKRTIKDKDATLLCTCKDEALCHRAILRGLLSGQGE